MAGTAPKWSAMHFSAQKIIENSKITEFSITITIFTDTGRIRDMIRTAFRYLICTFFQDISRSMLFCRYTSSRLQCALQCGCPHLRGLQMLRRTI